MPGQVVPLNEDHVCSFCVHDTPSLYYGEDALRQVFDRHKAQSRAQNRPYDCLLLLSGGKDSIYALYKLVKDFDMNVLAYSYYTAFVDEQAPLNVQNAVETLGVDLLINRHDEAQKRYLRHNIAKFATADISTSKGKASLAAVSHLLCVGCGDGYRKSAYQVAKKHGIQLMIDGGGNPVAANLNIFLNPASKTRYQELVAKPLMEVCVNPVFRNVFYYKNILRHMPILNPDIVLRSLANKTGIQLSTIYETIKKIQGRGGIEELGLYNYVAWDERVMVDTIERELGWRRAAGRSTTTRFDCKVHILLDHIRKQTLGVAEKEVLYSNMIRREMLTRDEALQRIETENREEEAIIDDVVQEILGMIGASDKFEAIQRLYA